PKCTGGAWALGTLRLHGALRGARDCTDWERQRMASDRRIPNLPGAGRWFTLGCQGKLGVVRGKSAICAKTRSSGWPFGDKHVPKLELTPEGNGASVRHGGDLSGMCRDKSAICAKPQFPNSLISTKRHKKTNTGGGGVGQMPMDGCGPT